MRSARAPTTPNRRTWSRRQKWLDSSTPSAPLPLRERAAMVLFYVLDLPVADVAARMGVAAPTVRVHLMRGRRRLRDLLRRRRGDRPVTKRWERELRRLGDVDAPTERIRAARRRSSHRPLRTGMASRPADSASPPAWWPSWCSLPPGTVAWQAFRPGGDNAHVVAAGPRHRRSRSPLVAEPVRWTGRPARRASLQMSPA